MPEHVPSEVVAAALARRRNGGWSTARLADDALRALATDERVRPLLALAIGRAWEAEADAVWPDDRDGRAGRAGNGRRGVRTRRGGCWGCEGR